jgi:hypothetical protein
VTGKLQAGGIDGSQSNNKNNCLHSSSLSSMAQAQNESECNTNSKMMMMMMIIIIKNYFKKAFLKEKRDKRIPET